MKTKLLFDRIQNCKNGILSILIIFFMTIFSFGQSDGITFNITCSGFPGTIEFDSPDGNINGFDSWSNDKNSQGYLLFAETNVNPVRWELYNPGGTELLLSSEVFLNDLPSCNEGDWISGPNLNCSATEITCPSPPDPDNDGDGFPASIDCDDNDATVNTEQEYFVDADFDGFGSTTTAFVCASSPPAGYSLNSDDCDDMESTVYPGAPEVCDGLDNDCDDPELPEEDRIDEGIVGCIDGVIIEYCDDKQKKVLICHNGKTKCVSINALDAHLAHGDYLGTCGNSKEILAEERPTSYNLVSWPNPTNDLFNIRMKTPNYEDEVNLQAFDINGRLIYTDIISGNEDYQFGYNLQAGIYFVKVTQAETTQVIKVIKQ